MTERCDVTNTFESSGITSLSSVTNELQWKALRCPPHFFTVVTASFQISRKKIQMRDRGTVTMGKGSWAYIFYHLCLMYSVTTV